MDLVASLGHGGWGADVAVPEAGVAVVELKWKHAGQVLSAHQTFCGFAGCGCCSCGEMGCRGDISGTRKAHLEFSRICSCNAVVPHVLVAASRNNTAV